MATQEINYQAGNDTGERESDAIAPIQPGNLVKSAVANRPTECLRNRSEVLRDELIDQKYLQDTDIMWFIAEGLDVTGDNAGVDLPQILWDPVAGIFDIGPAVDTALVLQPIKTPKTDTTDSMTYTFAPAGDTVTITSAFRNYQGANRRQVKWATDAIPGIAQAALSGAPDHILTITVDIGGTSTTGMIDSALFALGSALGDAGFQYLVVGGTDFIPVTPLPADHSFGATHEREMHRIPRSQFAAFFAVPTNALEDGDTLAVYYEWMIEPQVIPPPPLATGGRRQACPTNLNIGVTAGQLFITTHEPAKIPFSVPICKRIGNDLIFLDGTICYGAMTPAIAPVYAGEHGYTVNRVINVASTALVNIVNTWANALPVTDGTGTINQALNGIVGDLANTALGLSGALRVGAVTMAGTPDSLLTDSVDEQLAELLLLTNARIRTIHPTAAAPMWILLWRSSNVVANPAVTKSTVSLYWMDGMFALVVGAYWSTPTTLVPGIGVGDVTMSVWGAPAVGTITAIKNNPVAPFAVNIPPNWDFYDCASYIDGANYTLINSNARKILDAHLYMSRGRVTLREGPSDNNWNLVSRNNGHGVINTDVSWDTLSVYERNDDSGAEHWCGRMEVYGGYVQPTAPHGIITAPGGTGNEIVWFTYDSNDKDAQHIFGMRVGAGGGVPLSPFDPGDWDYHDCLNFIMGNHKRNVTGTPLGTPGRSSVTQTWNIEQYVQSLVDFVSPFSQIKMGGRPWTTVLDGLYAIPEDPDDPTVWSSNIIWVSPGRALVNGRPIVKLQKTGVNPATHLMGDPGIVVLPTNDNAADIPGNIFFPDGTPGIPAWYYLWLRSDGGFYVGKRGPVSDYSGFALPLDPNRQYPGDKLYRPHLQEVHVAAGYTQADYVLVDVISLMQYTGGNYYWDCAPRVGGDERCLLKRKLPSAPASSINYIVRYNVNAPDIGVITTYLGQNDGPGNKERRSPGIPYGVTNRAILHYNWTATQHGDSNTQFYVESNSLLKGFSRHIGKRYDIAGVTTIIHDHRDEDRIEIVTDETAHVESNVSASGTGVDDIGLTLTLLGFKWDRNGGSQGHQHVY